ncbi:MAG: hypothetical protein WD512_10780 [Candidatus Paceibacterota bacterium]
MTYFTPSEKYTSNFGPEFGLKMNDRVLIRGKHYFGTVIGLVRKKFILLPRFLDRLDDIDLEKEAILDEFYITQLQKVS